MWIFIEHVYIGSDEFIGFKWQWNIFLLFLSMLILMALTLTFNLTNMITFTKNMNKFLYLLFSFNDMFFEHVIFRLSKLIKPHWDSIHHSCHFMNGLIYLFNSRLIKLSQIINSLLIFFFLFIKSLFELIYFWTFFWFFFHQL